MNREVKKKTQVIAAAIAKKYRAKELDVETVVVSAETVPALAQVLNGTTVNALKATKEATSVTLVVVPDAVVTPEGKAPLYVMVVDANGVTNVYGSAEDPLSKGATKSIVKVYAVKAKRDAKNNDSVVADKQTQVLAQVANSFA